MAYDSIYTRINWENEKNTPLGATNLNKMDAALSEIDKRVVNLSTTKAEQETVLNLVSDWQMNEETGIITVTKVNGEKIVFDLNVEKIPVSFGMSEDGILSMTTEDGSVFTANIGDMIPIMTFNSSDSVNVTLSEDENGKVYTFEVKEGSITEEKLNPNYLASLKVASETAKENADIAIENANSAIDSAESAKQYRDEALEFRNQAENIVGVDIATTEKAGLVKPDGTTITVDADGTIHSVGGSGTGTTDYEDLENKPSINGVELSGNKTTADLGITNATQSTDGLMSASDKKKLDRTVASLVPNISIPANADLNTIEYTKIGTYYCQDNNRAQTLTNCPTSAGFTMEVYNVLNTKINNESSDAYVYRLRKITTWNGEVFYQTVSSGSTAGVYSYRNWEEIYSSFNKPTASDVGADASGSAAQALTDAKAYTDEKVPTKISQLKNDGKFVELDEYGNLDVPERVKANTAEFSDGIYSSGGIYEDNQYGGNAVVKTEDELSSLTAEGYMPDALLVKALHQSMGGYSFYNNPYVVYEVSTSSPFLLNGEYILSDSDTGYTYVGEYTEVYYSEIIEGDFKRRAGADTVSPFNLAKESIVVNKTDGTTATYTIKQNCLLIVQSLESNETSAFNSTIPTVDENITLIELSKNVVGRGGYHSGVAVYQALVNGSGNVSLTKNRTALYIIL